MTGIFLLIAACLNTIQAEKYTIKQYYQLNHPTWGLDGSEIPNEWEEYNGEMIILWDHIYGIVFKTETYIENSTVNQAVRTDTAIFNNSTHGRYVETYYYQAGVGWTPYRTAKILKANPYLDITVSSGDKTTYIKTHSNSSVLYDTIFYFTVESPQVTIKVRTDETYPHVNLSWTDTTILMQYKKETIHLECYNILDGYRVADLQLDLTWPSGEEWRPENMGLKEVSATTANNETVTGVNELTLKSTDQYKIRCIPESELCGVETADGSDMTIQRKPTKRHYEEVKSFNVKYGIHTQLHKVKFIYPSRCVDFQLTVDGTVRESTDPETGYKVFSIIGTEATVRLKSTEFEGEEKYFNITGYTGRITGLNPNNNIPAYTVEDESKTEKRTDTIIVRCLEDNANFKVDLHSPVHSQTEGENDTTHIVLASHSDGWVKVSVTAENEESAEIKCLTPNALLSPIKHGTTRIFAWVCKSILGKEQRKVLVIRRKSNIATIEQSSTLHITEENEIAVLGTTLPEITLTDPKATCIINDDKTSITVTSEDEIVQQTYSIRYFNWKTITVEVCGKIAEYNGETYTVQISKNSEWSGWLVVISSTDYATATVFTPKEIIKDKTYVIPFQLSKYGFVVELEIAVFVSDAQTDINITDRQTLYTVIDIKTGRTVKDNVKAKEAAELIKKLRNVTAIQKK